MCVMVRQCTSLDKFMASRTSGHFALRVWTVKKCLHGHGVHNQRARSPYGRATTQLSILPKPKPHTPLSCTCTWYMYFGARSPSPQRVHQFRGLTLVLQNFSCLDMTRLKKTLHKRFSHNVSHNVATSLAPASGFLLDLIKVSREAQELPPPRVFTTRTFHKQFFSLALVYKVK